jgi:hypothetical protein
MNQRLRDLTDRGLRISIVASGFGSKLVGFQSDIGRLLNCVIEMGRADERLRFCWAVRSRR